MARSLPLCCQSRELAPWQPDAAGVAGARLVWSQLWFIERLLLGVRFPFSATLAPFFGCAQPHHLRDANNAVTGT